MSTTNISHDSICYDSSDELESSQTSNMEIVKINTKNLAGERDKNGRTLIHRASANGNLQTVKILMELDPKLCHLRDNDSLTPLHLAVMKRHTEVTREIISGFPESLEVLTDQGKTVFHLVLEDCRNQNDIVEVLLEQVKKHGKQDLLFKQDRNGNNVAHIAVSDRRLEIVQLLKTSTNDFTKLVNSLNGSGYTALDLHYLNKSHDVIAGKIRKILWKAGACEAVQVQERSSEDSEPSSPEGMTEDETMMDERRNRESNILLVVVGILIATVFAAVAGLPSFFPKENKVASEPFQFGDAVAGDLPIIFYIILCLTVIISISMGYMIKFLYSHLFGHLLQVAMVAIFILYILLAYSMMPKFFVTIGPHHISSFGFMWILTSSIILFGIVFKLLKMKLSSPKSRKAEDEAAAGSSKYSPSLKGVHAVRFRKPTPLNRD
ncbi:putative Ankyrin repeat-containing protein [Melia azedarach]|uniref:Ankyrin repeat-containing protein n=1 Tax=Melia azedarach TaxID=155640 RepID=A0ACC1X526_MELAZ|nr:putative Ankyrin repeat-containing protein [Melia azedarach]